MSAYRRIAWNLFGYPWRRTVSRSRCRCGPTLEHDVGDQPRPPAGFYSAPVGFDVATDRHDQGHIESAMPNGKVIVAGNYPDISVAVDDHALPGRRVAGSCVRAGFVTPLQHVSLIDRSWITQTSRCALAGQRPAAGFGQRLRQRDQSRDRRGGGGLGGSLQKLLTPPTTTISRCWG